MTNECGIIILSSDEEKETQSVPKEDSMNNAKKKMNTVDEKKRSGSPTIIDKSTFKKRIALTSIKKNDDIIKFDSLKPGLVECERRPVQKSSEEIFTMFIGQCLQRKRSPSMDKIVSKLKRHYEQMDEKYAQSESFINLLNEKRENLMNSNKHLYTNISYVDDEMKNHKKGKNKINEIYESIPGPSTSKQNNNLIFIQENHNNMNNDNNNNNNNNNNDNVDKMKHENKKIHKIMLTMQECRNRIKKLEEAEVDFDDENNSNYIKLEKYKTRMTELHYKLCEITGENKDANRSYLRPKHYKVTKIPSVDYAINSFINKKLKNRTDKTYSTVNSVIFPDYHDIYDCINKCNNKQKLGMTTKAMRLLAKSSFEELGQQLQRERELDYWDTFSMWFENDDDPAKVNLDLRAKLDRNKEEGDEKLKKIFDEFAIRQEKTTENDDEDDEDNDNTEKSLKTTDDEDKYTDMDIDDDDDDEDDEDDDDEDEDEEEKENNDDGDDDDEDNADKVDNINNIDDWEMIDENNDNIVDKSDKEIIKINEINNQDTKCDKINTKELLNNNKIDDKIKTIIINDEKNNDKEDKNIIQNNKITEKSIDNLSVVIENIRVESFTKIADKAVDNLTDAIDNLTDAVDNIKNTVKISNDSIVKLIDKKTEESSKKPPKKFLEVIVDSSDIIDKPEIIINDDEKITPTPDSTTSDSNVAQKDIEVIQEIKTDENLECETVKQPMLKLRSFAKQPDFWNNSQNTVDEKANPKKSVNNNNNNNNKTIEIVDLDEDDNSVQVLPPQVPTVRLKNSKVIGLSGLNSTEKLPKIVKKLQLNPLASRSIIQLKASKNGLPRLIKTVPLRTNNTITSIKRQSSAVVTGIRQVVAATTQSSKPVSTLTRPLSTVTTTNVRPLLGNSQQLRPVAQPVRQLQPQTLIRQIVRPSGVNVCTTYGFTKTVTTKPGQQVVTLKSTSTTTSSASPTSQSRVALRTEGSGVLNLVPISGQNSTLSNTNRITTVNNTKK